MSAKSRTKGHSYEREIAAFYRSCGLEAHRGQQSDANVKPPDVVLPGRDNLWIECGRRKQGCWIIDKWNQAVRDGEPADPVLHVRCDRGDDLVVISLAHWRQIVEATYRE